MFTGACIDDRCVTGNGELHPNPHFRSLSEQDSSQVRSRSLSLTWLPFALAGLPIPEEVSLLFIVVAATYGPKGPSPNPSRLAASHKLVVSLHNFADLRPPDIERTRA